MPQVADTHNSFELVHTGIGAHMGRFFMGGEAEVHDVLHGLKQLGILVFEFM